MAWELILKKIPTDKEWSVLITKIKNDELPTNRKKYVKYSSLDSITRKMVNYYFTTGKNKEKQRNRCMKGILEEMSRSSNVRFDVEDKSKNR